MIQIQFDPWMEKREAEKLASVAQLLKIPVGLVQQGRPQCASANVEIANALLAEELSNV